MGHSRVGVVGVSMTLMLVASACFGSGGGSSSTRPRQQTSNVASNDPGCQFIVASDLKRSTLPLINQAEYLTSATATPTVCYDKISFIFDKGNNPDLPPSYTVQYKQGPFAPGLNTATESLSGVHAILEVTMTPASLTDVRSPSNPNSTYRGNLRLALPGTRHTLIVELLRTFPQPSLDPNAGVVVWLIGLDSKRPFTTDSANSPPRVNVLIMN